MVCLLARPTGICHRKYKSRNVCHLLAAHDLHVALQALRSRNSGSCPLRAYHTQHFHESGQARTNTLGNSCKGPLLVHLINPACQDYLEFHRAARKTLLEQATMGTGGSFCPWHRCIQHGWLPTVSIWTVSLSFHDVQQLPCCQVHFPSC